MEVKLMMQKLRIMNKGIFIFLVLIIYSKQE